MAEETNPANPDETKPQGEAGEKQPAAKEAAPKAEAAKEGAPKAEAAPKRPAAKKTAKPKKEQPAPAAGATENLSLSTEEVDKPKIVKAKGSKNVHSGVAHVLATFNNTIVTITDLKGNVIGWSSAGKVGFKGSRKSTAYAAQMVAQDASRQAMGHGLKGSGSVGQRTRSRTRIRRARFAGDRARSHGDSRRYAGAAQRLSSAKAAPRLMPSTINSQL